MKHLYLLLAFWLSATAWAYAQQESTLGTMRSLPQHTYNNPAFIPQQKLYIGLPGISSFAGSASSNSFTYKQLQASGLLDSLSATGLNAIKAHLKDENNIFAGAQTDLFSIGFRANPRLYLRYRASAYLNQRTILPRSLVLLADENFILRPQSIVLNPSLDAMAYLENSLGASYLVNSKFTIGANLKRMNGLASIATKELEVQLASNPDDQYLHVEGQMLVLISGEKYFEELAGIGFSEGGASSQSGEITVQSVRQDIAKNGGWAVDFGATYQLTPKLQLGLSVLDLGYIKWGNNAREYRVDQAEFTLESLEDSNEEAVIDSLQKHFMPKDKDIASFRTKLPMRTFLTASYEIARNFAATGIFFTHLQDGLLVPGFTAALHKDFGRRLGTSISYTATNGSYNNLGAGLSFRLSPFQLYVVTDNILSAINYENAQHVNVRAGLNLVFGTIQKPTKLPY